ncbi:MAG: hypothetical protein HKL92_02450 [Candidatus Eremiobacteraeota bacterium]|nr:hypothetical protein [Candidatus Eremiobacteraeota bacterium]NNM92178.1 hypothetical protein [Candidatus Eremiobacteraeota bacterium]
MSTDGNAQSRAVVTIRPHRSHRTLRVNAKSWTSSGLTVVIGVAATYAVLQALWPRIIAMLSRLLSLSGVTSSREADFYLGIHTRVPVPSFPAVSVELSLKLAGICALLLLVVSVLPLGKSPLRYWINANIFVLLLTSLYAFFTGTAAYGNSTFMLLVERTSILMILTVPIFSGMVSAFLPFSIVERVGMVVLTVMFDMVFAAVRIIVFALLTARFGSIVEANLYLFFGPLMDVVYFLSIFSLAAVSLGKRLSRNAEAWEWL